MWVRREVERVVRTPSLNVAKLLVSVAAEKGLAVMLLDIKCAFLCEEWRRSVYIELPRQDPEFRGGRLMGKLKMAMCGARDALPPQMRGTVKEHIVGLEFMASEFHPPVYWN